MWDVYTFKDYNLFVDGSDSLGMWGYHTFNGVPFIYWPYTVGVVRGHFPILGMCYNLTLFSLPKIRVSTDLILVYKK